MKYDSFLEFVVDKVFSFGTFCVLVVVVFVGVIAVTVQNDIHRQRQEQQLTEFCYSRGMVPVDTNAGFRCVDPQSLVKAN